MGRPSKEAEEWASGSSKSTRRNYVNNFNRNQPSHERAIWGPLSHSSPRSYSSEPLAAEATKRIYEERLNRYKDVYKIVKEAQTWGTEFQVFEKSNNRFVGGYSTQELAIKIANEQFDKRKF
jgi:hypothetical protein